MTTILADHNVEGHAGLLLATIKALGLSELLDLRLAALAEVGLAANSSDREVWRRAQELDMVLLTANRRKREQDSLEQTLARNCLPHPYPYSPLAIASDFFQIETIAVSAPNAPPRFSLILEQYRGVPRLYIP